jgi:hypothetical protein
MAKAVRSSDASSTDSPASARGRPLLLSLFALSWPVIWPVALFAAPLSRNPAGDFKSAASIDPH